MLKMGKLDDPPGSFCILKRYQKLRRAPWMMKGEPLSRSQFGMLQFVRNHESGRPTKKGKSIVKRQIRERRRRLNKCHRRKGGLGMNESFWHFSYSYGSYYK
jgi:hypothetical protein